MSREEGLDELTPLVYSELRRMAARFLRNERRNHTLEPTALVHEAYLRLIRRDPALRSRSHLLALASHAMRAILVDHAKRRGAEKRGGRFRRVTLRLAEPADTRKEVDLLALDEALGRLAEEEPTKEKVVELRVFGGLSIEETAEVLGISTGSVKRYWISARAWLYRELSARDR